MLKILSASQYHLQTKQVFLVTWCILDPMDCSSPGSSVRGIFQARIPEWVAIPFSRGSSRPRIKPMPLASPELAGEFFTTAPSGNP